MKYRKKPVVIEAMQFTGEPYELASKGGDIIDWILNSGGLASYNCGDGCCKGVLGIHIQTLEGNILASPNDFVIKGVQGEFYPCKPDIFEATYEPVVE